MVRAMGGFEFLGKITSAERGRGAGEIKSEKSSKQLHIIQCQVPGIQTYIVHIAFLHLFLRLFLGIGVLPTSTAPPRGRRRQAVAIESGDSGHADLWRAKNLFIPLIYRKELSHFPRTDRSVREPEKKYPNGLGRWPTRKEKTRPPPGGPATD